MPPPQACAALAQMFARTPETKHLFVSEGGVLATLELLDSDSPKLLEPAVDLLIAFTSGDVRLLENLCLIGVVPLACRLTQQPVPERLRLKAAAFVQQLCFARDTTLQMFLACGGLR